VYGVGEELGHFAVVDVVVGGDHERAFTGAEAGAPRETLQALRAPVPFAQVED
jgi:hypothetical protein